jgi:hypothetical protein
MKYIVDESKLTDIADAIRGKTGGTQALTLDQMPTEISGISGASVKGYGYAFDNTVNLEVEVQTDALLICKVESVEGATYGFAMIDGYWTSQNGGIASSFAMCKVLFNFAEETTVTLKCINYAEKGFDYGLISEVDTMLALSSTADSEGVLKSFKDSNLSTVVNVPVTIPAGEHFLCIKFRKNSSINSNKDSLRFVVTL